MLFSEFNFYKVNFIDPASPLMYGIIELHDHIFFFLNMILFIVLFLIATTVNYFSYLENTKLNRYLISESVKNKYDWLRLNHGTTIEIIWTIIPSFILVLIAIPSFALLYATDELVDPAVTIQVIGHQWYWSYEYNDLVIYDTPDTLSNHPVLARSVNTKIKVLAASMGINVFTDKASLFNFLKTLDNTTLYQVLGIKTKEWSTYKFSCVDPDKIKIAALDYITPILQKDVALYKFLITIFSDKYRTINGETYFMEALDTLKLHKVFIADADWDRMLEWRENAHFSYHLLYGRIIGVTPVEGKLTHGSFEFDSYLKSEDDLKLGEQRLYETDFPLVLPKNTHIRFMITSDDVIHSWSVPALGIKVDAVPGRINHAHTFIKRSGVFYGQCSELCGVNHAFMPIQIIAFEPNMYYNYLRLVLLSK